MERTRTIMRYVMAASFVAIGVAHFLVAEQFVHIMPPYIPMKLELVWLSGVFEIAGGVGLLLPRFRRLAGYGIIALLVSVFIVNIEMAVHPRPMLDGSMVPEAALWARLPMQFVMAAWAWWVSKPDAAAADAPA